jgi:mono/diheme cytochrome c family protein
MRERARKSVMVLCGVAIGAVCTLSAGQNLPPASECPQPRFTGKAPDEYYTRTNPLTGDKVDLTAAERLYLGGRGEFGCAACHGRKGDGKGPMAEHFNPPPRNFACAQTVNGIPDGQLFWIIRYGSPGTAMPGHPKLSENQVWQMVLYLRQLAR